MKAVIHTYTGLKINPLQLQLEDIRIEDIAHALALCNRFAGHTKFPISVAQHSVYVSRLVDHTPYAMQGLLHDASEAYLGDMTKWLKNTPEMAAYRDAEAIVQESVYQKFLCPSVIQKEVECADRLMVRFEGRKGYGKTFRINHPDYPLLTEEEIARVKVWSPWTWSQAEETFLQRYHTLVGRGNSLPS